MIPSTAVDSCLLYTPFFRGGRGGQNDGAEDEGGGRAKEDKRNRREDVLGGNQRTGGKSYQNNQIHLTFLLPSVLPS